MPEGCVWPNTYLLGNPKSGSTFLFNCLRSGPFDPNLPYGRDPSKRGPGYSLLTTPGPKKEFKFVGGPCWGRQWGDNSERYDIGAVTVSQKKQDVCFII